MNIHQISVFLENRTGQLAEITRLLADNGIDLRALLRLCQGIADAFRGYGTEFSVDIGEKEYPEIYKQFRNLCTGPSEQFYENMKEIAHEIAIKGRSFDVFDYYFATKLHPLVFQNICEIIPGNQTIQLLRKWHSFLFEIDKSILRGK